MNSFNHNSTVDGVVVTATSVVCEGTVAAEAAAEGDTMSSEVRVG
jgi:hypothetical protein